MSTAAIPFILTVLTGRNRLITLGSWVLALVWVTPILYAVWAAFDVATASGTVSLYDNFVRAWNAAPFARYFFNTAFLVAFILFTQLVTGTLAGYAFARYQFPGRDILFVLLLVQMMLMPEVLLVENYRIVSDLGLTDSLWGISLPYLASAFCVFLLRQSFKQVPRELEDAARIEGAGFWTVLLKVYVPLVRPTYLAYSLVAVSFHWNNFLWPLIVTNSVETRPLSVGLQVFAVTDQGIDLPVISAATLITSAPLLIGFLIFQRQFIENFMRAGIK